MGGCASKPKDVDSAPCQAPTSPKNNIGGDDQQPLIDLSEPKNQAADSESEPAFARPAKATAHESEKKVIEDFVEKTEDQKPNKETEKQVEAVAVVEQTDNQEAADGEKARDQKANNKETEKKVEVAVEEADDLRKAADTEPAFARPAKKKAEAAVAENTKETEKKVEAATEKAKTTAKESEKIKVEAVAEKVKDAKKETEKEVEAVVVQETEKTKTDKSDVVS